ncbi:MAG: hypothetical protein RID91_12615 [Azospirillaceae bacterium]
MTIGKGVAIALLGAAGLGLGAVGARASLGVGTMVAPRPAPPSEPGR